MATLLLVDDELLSRTAFKMMLSKHCPKIKEIYEAENGESACKLASANSPDIIVMDIKMPILNGIEAAKIILSEKPETTIMMLTAHNDASYLQESINVGAKGYFLKPINIEEVSHKLNIIASEIDENNTNKSSPIELEKLILKPLLDKEIVRMLSLGTTNSMVINYYQELLNYKFDIGYFIIVRIINVDKETLSSMIALNKLKEKISSAISYSFNFMQNGIVGNFNSMCVPIFIPKTDSSNKNYIEQESHIISSELLKRLSQFQNIQVCVAIGRLTPNLEDAHIYFDEAMQIAPSLQQNQIVSVEKFSAPIAEVHYPYEDENNLLSAIRIRDQKKIMEFSSSISSKIFSTASNIHMLKEYSLQYVVFLKKCLYELGVDSHSIAISMSLSDLANYSSSIEFEETSRKQIEYFLKIILLQSSNKNYAIKQKISKYLDANFTDPISLETLSEYLDLSTQYVSKVFKAEFNENFIDYLTRRRIEEAKNRLESSDDSIATVSNAVGYIDQNYFCKIFKKYTGTTPKEYKTLFKNKL